MTIAERWAEYQRRRESNEIVDAREAFYAGALAALEYVGVPDSPTGITREVRDYLNGGAHDRP